MQAPLKSRPEPGPRSESEWVRSSLRATSEWMEQEGMARPELAGQLIRPLVALAGWRAVTREEPSAAFWWGALAVQLAHEASLLHDDVLDLAARRRGNPTLVADRGVGAALVQGDHLLTTAYRCAARTASPLFVDLFARAVERTVAGEISQGKAIGRILSLDQYEGIACGKAGELLGCALSLAPALLDPERVVAFHDLGCRFGVVYQKLDDLLDLSPSTDTGKPALSDYAQRHWTWPLAELGITTFGTDPRDLVRSFHSDAGAGAPIQRCLTILTSDIRSLETSLEATLGVCPLLSGLLSEWGDRAMMAVQCEAAAIAGRVDVWAGPSASLLARVPAEADVHDYLAVNSLSFRFATRFFSRKDEARVARVYAYCRCTDDLVDDPEIDRATAAALLDEWLALSRRAYAGKPSGITFLDTVMGEMAAAGVPLQYAEELVEGMRMDLQGTRYASLNELRVYTYRVASVVGLWISELFGVHDPATLQRAAAMGHAMQLTNIIRDVGEDLRAGRCYLPGDLMLRHGLEEAKLKSATELPEGYAALIEEMISATEASYRVGFEGISELPRTLRLPVAVAARVYRGILREVRRNDYDSLNRRARTSGPRKAALAAQALLGLGMPVEVPLRRGSAVKTTVKHPQALGPERVR
jgi:15-cis-phytoene synthase